MLRKQISVFPFLNIIGTYSKTHEAEESLHLDVVEVIFIDPVSEAELNWLKELYVRVRIVIVSHGMQWATDGYRIGVLDYILKPVHATRFQITASRILEYFKIRDLALGKQLTVEEQKYIFITSNYSLVKINLDDISHVEGLKDYVKIFTISQNNPILTRMTMKALEGKLPASRFFRVHKSYIVSLSKIEAIRNQRVKIGQYMIPVSDANYDLFRKRVNGANA